MIAATNGRRYRFLTGPDGRTPARAELRNRYEAGGWTYTPTRSHIYSGIQDAERDINRSQRREVLRRVRYLWENSPILAGIVESIVTYTVGAAGVYPFAASSRKAWNRKADKAFWQWARNPYLRGRMDFPGYQRVVMRAMALDGDVLTILTSGPSGRPRLAFVEAPRCTTPASERIEKDEPDGIRLDAYGRPVSYTVAKSEDIAVLSGATDDAAAFNSENWIVYPAESVVLHFLPLRPGQYRGISMFASAVTTVQDIHDLIKFEKQSVKYQATRVDIIETVSGELDPESVLRGGTDVLTPSCEPEGYSQQYYEEIFGSEVKALRRGDKFTPYSPTRPTSTWSGFMDWLVGSVCLSVGLPPSVMAAYGRLSGSDTRRDLARAARVFRQWQSELAAQFQQIWNYVIGWEAEQGELQGTALPDDWRRVNWQYPKPITVDYGREAQQDREDVRTGLLSLKDYYARQGIDWRSAVRQLYEEAGEVSATDPQLYERLYVPPKAQQPPDGAAPVNPDSSKARR